MTDGVSKIHIEQIDSITFLPSMAAVVPDNNTQINNNKAAICWIDDDFAIIGNNYKNLPIYREVHRWLMEKDIRLDFATPTFSSQTTIDSIKAWEEDGFYFLMHPTHDGWYDYNTTKHDIARVRSHFIKNMRFFQEHIASARRRILVYPGNSNTYPANVEFIKQHVECAITTKRGTNPGAQNDRYQLKRITMQLSATHTKSQVKEYIRQGVENGDWIILYTHIYSFEISDVLDETTNSLANLYEIVEYANSLSPLRSTESIWSERRKLYGL